MYKNIKYTLSLLIVLLWVSCSSKKVSLEESLTTFFAKEEVTIVVTDSGLGGISVAADVVNRMENSGVFSKVNVIFFNAQPHDDSGYNGMKSLKEKVTVFNNALNAMQEHFDPDLLLIGCNTLSVLYDYTDFSKKVNFPVKGIVDTGVELITQKTKDSNADVYIFATETTINQGQHKAKLLQLGHEDTSIYTQSCPKLAGIIENNPDSDETKALVNQYVKDAAKDYIKNEKPLYVSYNCTHFGYVDRLFKEAFKTNGIKVADFLNPNELMADFMFTPTYRNRFEKTKVSVRVVSQPKLSEEKLNAIANLIKGTSVKTADALLEYEFTPNYFKWQL